MFVEQPQLHWVWQANIIAAYSQSTSPPARGSAGARGTPLGPAVTVTSSSLAGHCCYVCCPSFPAPPLQLPYSSLSAATAQTIRSSRPCTHGQTALQWCSCVRAHGTVRTTHYMTHTIHCKALLSAHYKVLLSAHYKVLLSEHCQVLISAHYKVIVRFWAPADAIQMGGWPEEWGLV